MKKLFSLVLVALCFVFLPAAAAADGFNLTLYPSGSILQAGVAFDGVELFATGSYDRYSRSVNGDLTSESSEIGLGGGGRFRVTSAGDVDLYATGGLTWLFPANREYESRTRFHAGGAALFPVGLNWGLVGEAGLEGQSTRLEDDPTITQTYWNTYARLGIRLEL